MSKVKAILREEDKVKEVSCFVDGCRRDSRKCKGIPKSNVCAACRLKKNYLGVED